MCTPCYGAFALHIQLVMVLQGSHKALIAPQLVQFCEHFMVPKMVPIQGQTYPSIFTPHLHPSRQCESNMRMLDLRAWLFRPIISQHSARRGYSRFKIAMNASIICRMRYVGGVAIPHLALGHSRLALPRPV